MIQNNVLIILGHQNGQHIFDLNLPMWLRNQIPIQVFSAKDQPLDPRGFPQLHNNSPAHSGSGVTDRIKLALRWFIDSGYDNVIICEHDSFVTEIKPEVLPGLHGLVAQNYEPARFYSPRYVGPPWTLDFESAQKLHDVAEDYPDLHEEGYDDRYISALAFLAGVPILPHKNTHFFVATILPEHREMVLKAKAAGAKWWHGIKDEAALKLITDP